MLEPRDLGAAGEAYLHEHLRDANSFCAALLETVTRRPGQTFTLAPVALPAARLTEFHRGGFLPNAHSVAHAVRMPDGSSLAPIVSLIVSQMKLLLDAMNSVEGAVCVVDDFNSRWSELAPDAKRTAFGVEEEVYHLLTADHDEDDFLTSLSVGNALWHGVAAVCGVAPALSHARIATKSELARCAASAQLITCAAYDGEGFVAWRPNGACV